MPKIDNFKSMLNRNKVRDWGWDGETNEVAADSSMMTDRSRVKTEPHYKENPKYMEALKRSQKKGVPMDYSIYPGKWVDEPCDLMNHVRGNMGSVIRGTIYKSAPKKKTNNKGIIGGY